MDGDFHRDVKGVVGYMSAYLDEKQYDPIAISYFMQPGYLQAANPNDVYFYLTRRPFGTENGPNTLVSLGGPEMGIGDQEYSPEDHQPGWAHDQIARFFHDYYRHGGPMTDFTFRWHGLMGMTKT